VWLGVSLRSRISKWVLGLIVVQILLGVTDVLLLAPTWMQVLHLLGADAYWIALVAACSGVFAGERRRVRAVLVERVAEV
jgi:heme a synthase